MMWGIEKMEISCAFEVWGDIEPKNVMVFCEALQQLPQESRLYMWDLSVDDGPTLAQIISAIRMIAPCILIGAPQMLAHTLYKINALQYVHLKEPRSF